MPQDVEKIVAGLSEADVAALTRPGRIGSVEQRFWAHTIKRGPDDCWLWKGRPSSRGYGRLTTPWSSSTPAHRVSFMLHHGSIPDGHVIDHICRERTCVNPAHLRCVTPRINGLENSLSPAAINAKKTHCLHGHPLSGENLIHAQGGRRCRTCQRGFQRNLNAKIRLRKHLLSTPNTEKSDVG